MFDVLLKSIAAVYVELYVCLAAQCIESLNPLQCAEEAQRLKVELVSVVQSCSELIRCMQDKAYSMFNAGAYLHQYQQFGIDKQDFEGCFARIEDIYASYKAL